MMWGPDYGAGGWAMMFGSIVVGVILIALVVLGVAWLVRSQQAAPSAGDGMSAQAILDARYARGEIDEADYKRRRELLASGSRF
ncbi:MAG: SHOCT domain-containing protein [Candidatus Dormiibacterota bacterium]